MTDDRHDKHRIGELEDEVKHRDRRIEELRKEIDDQRDLIRRLEEHAEDYEHSIEQWCETFGMEMTDDGWSWGPFWRLHHELADKYGDLVRRWNRYVGLFNQNPVGRPLAASEAQCAQVKKLRKRGASLRGIADDTGLGLNTVRTIIAKTDGADRTTKKHRARIEIDRQEVITQRRQRRTGDALPGRVNRFLKSGRELVKQAKGLK